MSPRVRLALVVVAVAILVAAFVLARGSGDDDGGARDAASTPAATAPPAATTPSGSATGTTAADPAPAPKPAIPVVRVVDAKPAGGVRRLSFSKGDRIRFAVRSDTADEIHVHGYDIHEDVAAGGRATFSFPATIEGRFTVELEDHATEIVELEVNP